MCVCVRECELPFASYLLKCMQLSLSVCLSVSPSLPPSLPPSHFLLLLLLLVHLIELLEVFFLHFLFFRPPPRSLPSLTKLVVTWCEAKRVDLSSCGTQKRLRRQCTHQTFVFLVIIGIILSHNGLVLFVEGSTFTTPSYTIYTAYTTKQNKKTTTTTTRRHARTVKELYKRLGVCFARMV